jgi:rod shape-determining protein MreB
LSGGGALLAGITQRVTHETGMPCYIAPDPLYAVAIGSGLALENIEAMRGMMSSPGLDQQ